MKNIKHDYVFNLRNMSKIIPSTSQTDLKELIIELVLSFISPSKKV